MPLFQFKKDFRAVFIRDGERNKSVDGLRALAILMVFSFHVVFFTQYLFQDTAHFLSFISNYPRWLVFLWHGDKGVDVFFVISGFLIAWILLKAQEGGGSPFSYRVFYQNRFARIVPLYVVAMLFYGLSGMDNADYFWSNLLLLNNIITVDHIFIPWSWSLTIELQFYLLAPFVLWASFLSSRPLLVLFVLIIVLSLLRVWLVAGTPLLFEDSLLGQAIAKNDNAIHVFFDRLYVNLYTRATPLLAGMMVAIVWARYMEEYSQWEAGHLKTVWVIHAVLLCLFVWSLSAPVYHMNILNNFDPVGYKIHLMFSKTFFSIFVAWVLLNSITMKSKIARVLDAGLSKRFWYPISQTSYALYLFHIPMLFLGFVAVNGTEKLIEISMLGMFLSGVVGLIFSFFLALLCFVFIERPAQRLLKRNR